MPSPVIAQIMTVCFLLITSSQAPVIAQPKSNHKSTVFVHPEDKPESYIQMLQDQQDHCQYLISEAAYRHTRCRILKNFQCMQLADEDQLSIAARMVEIEREVRSVSAALSNQH